jgi:hypothetical protein
LKFCLLGAGHVSELCRRIKAMKSSSLVPILDSSGALCQQIDMGPDVAVATPGITMTVIVKRLSW